MAKKIKSKNWGQSVQNYGQENWFYWVYQYKIMAKKIEVKQYIVMAKKIEVKQYRIMAKKIKYKNWGQSVQNFLSMKWQWTCGPTLLPWNNVLIEITSFGIVSGLGIRLARG